MAAETIPPEELRGFFDAVKMIAASLVQNQQFLSMDLQQMMLTLSLDDRFEGTYSKQALDAISDRQQAQFRLISTAIAKLHNLGVRLGFQPGEIVDERQLLREFKVMSESYRRIVDAMRRKLDQLPGEDWE